MELSTEVLWQLTLGRRFLRRAVDRSFDPGKIAAIESVIAAQDGLEFLLWAIITAGGRPPKGQRPNFDTIIAAAALSCPRVSALAPEMRRVNILRGKAKHQGMPPEPADAAKRVRRAMDIGVDLVAQAPLGLDLLALSSTTTFRHRLLAREIDAAESLLGSTVSEDIVECQKHLGFAYSLAARELKSLSTSSSVSQVSSNNRSSSSDRGLSRDIDEVARATDSRLDEMLILVSAVGFGASIDTWLRWRRLLPHVGWTGSGEAVYGHVPYVDTSTLRDIFAGIVRLAESLEERWGRFASVRNSTVEVAGECEAHLGEHVVCVLRKGEVLQRQGSVQDGQLPVRLFGISCTIPMAEAVVESDA